MLSVQCLRPRAWHPPSVVRHSSTTPFPDKGILRNLYNPDAFTTFYRAREFPKTLADYWRVAQVMQRKGLITFVHGQKSSWVVPQRVLSALGYNHCRSLRAPGQEFSKGAAEIMAEVKTVVKIQKLNPIRWFWLYYASEFTWGQQQLDHQVDMRRHLMAVTLGAFHWEADESPFNYVFGGDSASKYFSHPGNRSVMAGLKCRKIASEMISHAMKETGYHTSAVKALLDRVWTVYDEAERLPIGQILAIGVPERLLEQVVYHSRAFGIPTGYPMRAVVEGASKGGGHDSQARLILSKESMSRDSGIEVVNIMDQVTVEKYCEGVALTSPWEDVEMQKMLDVKWRAFHEELLAKDPDRDEDKIRAKFRDLHEKLDRIIHRIIQLDDEHARSR